jgi:hypothetical protein
VPKARAARASRAFLFWDAVTARHLTVGTVVGVDAVVDDHDHVNVR